MNGMSSMTAWGPLLAPQVVRKEQPLERLVRVGTDSRLGRPSFVQSSAILHCLCVYTPARRDGWLCSRTASSLNHITPIRAALDHQHQVYALGRATYAASCHFRAFFPLLKQRLIAESPRFVLLY